MAQFIRKRGKLNVQSQQKRHSVPRKSSENKYLNNLLVSRVGLTAANAIFSSELYLIH